VGGFKVEADLADLFVCELVASRLRSENLDPFLDLSLADKVRRECGHLVQSIEKITQVWQELIDGHVTHITVTELDEIGCGDEVLDNLGDDGLLVAAVRSGGSGVLHGCGNTGFETQHSCGTIELVHLAEFINIHLDETTSCAILCNELSAGGLVLLCGDGVLHVSLLKVLDSLDDGVKIGHVIVLFTLARALEQLNLFLRALHDGRRRAVLRDLRLGQARSDGADGGLSETWRRA